MFSDRKRWQEWDRGEAICGLGPRSHRQTKRSQMVAEPTSVGLAPLRSVLSSQRPPRPRLHPTLPTLRHVDERTRRATMDQLAIITGNLTGQIQALADASGRESERAGGLEQTSLSIQEVVPNLAHRQEAGARSPTDHNGSSSLVGKNAVPEGLTNKTVCKQCGRRYNFMAGAEDEMFKVLLAWAELGRRSPPPSPPRQAKFWTRRGARSTSTQVSS